MVRLLRTTLSFCVFCTTFFMVAMPRILAQEAGVSPVAGVFLKNNADPVSAGLGMSNLASSYNGAAHLSNPAQMPSSPYIAGGSLSYNPWIIGVDGGDLFGLGLSGYYKLADHHGAYLKASFFNIGDITLLSGDPSTTSSTVASAYEWSATLGYAYAISDAFSIAVGVKYFESQLVSAYTLTDVTYSTASVVAGDLNLLYSSLGDSASTSKWNISFSLANLGTKATYSDQERPYFIPSYAALGVGYSKFLQSNTLRLTVEVKKDMVPYAPNASASSETLNAYYEQGIFEAWGKAFGESTLGVYAGAEFVYSDLLFFRLGYFNENFSYYKRDAFTFGLGYVFPFGLSVNLSYQLPGVAYISSSRFANSFSIGVSYEY